MACTGGLDRPILVGALVFYSPPVMPGVLSNRKLNTNPYETSEQVSTAAQTLNATVSFRTLLLALVSFTGIGNTAAALIDAYREGYPTLDGYLFIGIATLIPLVIGLIGMLVLIVRGLTTYLLWCAGSFVALLPGLLIWTLCAAMPSPRSHMGAGQMHIFFLPVIHIGYCILVYLGTALLALVVSRTPKE